MAALRPTLYRDVLPRRRPQVNQQELAKRGGRVRRYNPDRPRGQSVTVAFTMTPELDDLIDYWTVEHAVTRSRVVRQALLLADEHWRRERSRKPRRAR